MLKSGPKVKFWGVRGSLPAPVSDVDGSAQKLLLRELQYFKLSGIDDLDEYMQHRAKQTIPVTFGGNTLCVEVRCRDQIIVLDMGTGIRLLGSSLFPEMMDRGGLEIDFLLSHVHWDHIQGLPFFGPLHINKAMGKDGIQNTWNFHGGIGWQATAEVCLRGQMDPPRFPISFTEIEKISHKITFTDLYDLLTMKQTGKMDMLFRKLDHPQETYGVRLTDRETGKVIAYTTDNEPRDPRYPDPNLVMLAKDADIWITDCQYTQETYHALKGGPKRYGWGHSYPEAIAQAALEANPKVVVLFHHDPASDDSSILQIEYQTQELIKSQGGKSEVIAAWEGLTLKT